MNHILIVEDEKPISELMRLSLRKAGYQTTCAYDGAQAADLLECHSYDLVLLDVMLPKVDGFELMQYLRPTGTPVIFITAKNSLTDRVRGLRMGAEDYIVKPFEILELLARVDVVLRRYHKTEAVLEVGGLRIDTVAMQVTRGGAAIALTKRNTTFCCCLHAIRGSRFTARRSTSASGTRNFPSAAARSICTFSAYAKRPVGRTACVR